MVTRTAIETARVAVLVSPAAIARSVLANFSSVVPLPASTPNMPADLAHRDLDADAGQEADQHAARQEVGDEPEPEQARREEQDAAHEGGQTGQGDVLGRSGDGARRHEAGRQDRGRGRVGADDEVARRAEDGEQEDRQQQGVEARDHGHPGDLRVAHHLGDGQRGQGRAGDDVDRDAGRIDRQQPLQDRQRRARLRRGLCRHRRAPSCRVRLSLLDGRMSRAASVRGRCTDASPESDDVRCGLRGASLPFRLMRWVTGQRRIIDGNQDGGQRQAPGQDDGQDRGRRGQDDEPDRGSGGQDEPDRGQGGRQDDGRGNGQDLGQDARPRPPPRAQPRPRRRRRRRARRGAP